MTKQISGNNRVARYCKKKQIENGTPMPAAFELQYKSKEKKVEEFLSVNWIEYFGPELEQSMKDVRREFKKRYYKIDKKGQFAILSVEKIMSITTKDGTPLWVNDLEDEGYPSHSGVCGYRNDLDILIMLSDLVAPDDMRPAIPPVL